MKTTFFDASVTFPKILPNASCNEPCVLTIGNFDGLHLGHQAMLNQTMDIAKQQGLKSAVMVFEPMPKEFFNPQQAPTRLTNRLETQYTFENHRYGELVIDELIIADFNKHFRSLSAQAFADILINQFNVKAMVLGDDFRFGHDRAGDSAFLQQQGIAVTRLDTITLNTLDTGFDTNGVDNRHTNTNGNRVSSTRIRGLLAQGDLPQAKRLLGRDYYMIGQVMHGDKIGRTLNFPTANITLNRIKPALHGVFAVDVQVLDDSHQVIDKAWHQLSNDYAEQSQQEPQRGIDGLAPHSLFGTANIGTRPTIDGFEWRLEVHFPDFAGDIYDKVLKVRFLHFLHGEKKYAGLEALQAGIKQDVNDLIQWRQEQATDTRH